MRLDTYLTFDGNCRDAFEFYSDALGADITVIQTFGDAPVDLGVSPEHKDWVMHASLPVGPSVLMGSDNPPGFGPPLAVGMNFAISVHVENREEADRIFASLSEGGSVGMPMQDTFWQAYFGMLTDRFGIRWQIHLDLSQD